MDLEKPLKSLNRLVRFEITKSKTTKTVTIIKFIGLDLLKILVIIISFCIFAFRYQN